MRLNRTFMWGALLLGASNVTAAPNDDELIASALAAAPAAVASKASVAVINQDGTFRFLRTRPGQFTCFPDNPMSPGTDPMCLDGNAILWLKALLNKQQPREGVVGLAYMLMGGSDASNADPYAGQPKPGARWVDTGPHLMILNAPSLLQGYPAQSENPDTSVPYVMWPGTPYAHLMVPVH